MKKFLLAILIISIAGASVFWFYQTRIIELVINDQLIELDDPVIIEDEIIFVPAQPVFETLGAYTRWDPGGEVFSGILGEFEINLPAGSQKVIVDGEILAWDAPIKLVDDTIYAPVESAAEALGVFVKWDADNRELTISTPGEFDPEVGDNLDGPLLHVAYPPEYQLNYYSDSLFVFGTIQSYSQVDVKVNGEPVDLLNRKTGNFLTMLDIPRGEEFTVKVEASDGINTSTIERTVLYPEGIGLMAEEPLAIHSSHLIPRARQVLTTGETLRIVARGSPGATAYYQIGQGNFVPMTELEYPGGPPGRGGIYTAVYTVSPNDAPAAGISDTMPVTVMLEKDGQQVSRELPGQVAFFSELPYNVVEVKDSSELNYSGWFRIIRDNNYQIYSSTRGGTGYSDDVASYLTAGTRFETVGSSGNYYRVKLEENETYLLHKDAVRELSDKTTLEPTLSGIELLETNDKVILYLNADERFPFLVDSGTDHLRVKIFGIDKDNTLEIPEITSSVRELNLKPLEGEPKAQVLAVKIEQPMTGFTPSWENTTLKIELDKPPRIDRENPLNGKTIVIDPGHGGKDSGAPGPGDLHEKDVVLSMSLYLEELLLEAGAEVIMTRTEDVDVDLYNRPEAQFINETDFFISVHANAHGHGADAVNTHGIMTLYNYDHNEKLAEIMLAKVTEIMDLPKLYTWKRNIAVTRYTQFPCVLVEAGYMMHPEDNWYILHPEGQKKFARAMKEGIEKYFLSYLE